MEKTFKMKLDGEDDDDDIVFYHREFNISGKLEDFLLDNLGKDVEITIKVLDKKKA